MFNQSGRQLFLYLICLPNGLRPNGFRPKDVEPLFYLKIRAFPLVRQHALTTSNPGNEAWSFGGVERVR